MKYLKFLGALAAMILLLPEVHSQSVPSKYWVQFTDRDNSPYSVGNPSAYLSAKAINRRTMQGIAITENDLPVNPNYIDSVLSTGVTLLNSSKWFNAVTIYTLDTNQLNKIAGFPFVKQLQLVALTAKNPYLGLPGKNEKFGKPDGMEPLYGKSASLVFDYGPSFNQIHMVAGDALHEAGFRGNGMVIAILDAGFSEADTLHVFDSLWQNNQIQGTRDFVNAGGNVFGEHWHGMMVLSIMGGNVPGQLIGTAPKASYWLLRTEDANSEYLIEEDNWASGAEYADSVGADIINTSLGYNEFWYPPMNHTYNDMNGNTTRVTIAADIAASKGILVVCAAGNSGGSAWQYITAPADGDSVLSIGAVTTAGAYASFSSTGPTADGRIKPDVAAQGVGTIVALTNGSFAGGNGTSFSSPVIAGMSACLWQTQRTAGNMGVWEAIRRSGDQFLNPDSLRGCGIPDFMLAKTLLGSQSVDNHTGPGLISVYPNPFTDRIMVSIPSVIRQKIRIDLYDAAGKKILAKTVFIEKGVTRVPLDGLENLSGGFYLLQVTSEGSVNFLKLLR